MCTSQLTPYPDLHVQYHSVKGHQLIKHRQREREQCRQVKVSVHLLFVEQIRVCCLIFCHPLVSQWVGGAHIDDELFMCMLLIQKGELVVFM